MGQQQSSGAHEAVDEVEETFVTPEGTRKSTKLYKYVKAGLAGRWELASSNAQPRFYNANEDTGAKCKEWHLEIDAGDIDDVAGNNLGYVADKPGLRVTFQANESCWALKFPGSDEFDSFVEELIDKVFEMTFGYENDEDNRKKALGEDYAGFFQIKSDVQPIAMDVDDEPEPEGPTTPETLKDKEAKEVAKDDPITGLIMGGLDQSYLVRGNKFDVLRNVDGGVEDKSLSFQITPAKGASFLPGRVLLSHGESKMNILTPENRNALHHADIETGKVVSTFTFQKDSVEIPIREIAGDYKSAQFEERDTFLGLDSNRLCKWDLRTSAGVVQTTPIVNYTGGKDYARNTNFTCMATSGDGYVVVGSQDGKVRLYSDKSLTKANTSIPGLGAPITSVDVTYDGKWIVATTDYYLLVVNTIFKRNNVETNGFKSRMGKNTPLPRVLRLKSQDLYLTGNKPLKFGKFSWITESGRQERWVVASCGQYSVIWSFKKVKSDDAAVVSAGGLPTITDYYIKPKDEEVVESAFMNDRYCTHTPLKSALVIATPHKLFSVGN